MHATERAAKVEPMKTRDLLRRHGLFDAKVPRYTSYPPATRFTAEIGPVQAADWQASVAPGTEISLYIHIPFCRRLCWFCACRTQGTKTDNPLPGYVSSLIAEIDAVAARLPAGVKLSRLHLGGGTPTILPADQIDRLLGHLFGKLPLAQRAEFSVEIDPTEVDARRLDALVDAGMTRASLGVQDFDAQVQAAIGRTQSLSRTAQVIDMLRRRGVNSINIDLLYGLPLQTRRSLAETTKAVLALQPDRLALFGYAHVPWMSKRQVMIRDSDLPSPEERFDLFNAVALKLMGAGYLQIGIDHFAKPGDGLADALAQGTLRRNFQGYTDDISDTLIGLGASAISRFPQGYVQNASATAAYARAIAATGNAAYRGIRLGRRDKMIGDVIERLMCYGRVDLASFAPDTAAKAAAWLQDSWRDFADVASFDGQILSIHRAARPLVRVIAAHLGQDGNSATRHSSAI